MAEPKEPADGQRKVVGVYDRPASADRPRASKLIMIVVVVVIAVIVAMYFLRR